MDTSRPGTMQSRAMSRASTPLVNADGVERKLKDVIYRKWKDIQHQCRQYDRDNTGTISISNFRELMSQYEVHMSPEDFEDIITKYDIHENGRFCYTDFIRHFILKMKTRENTERSLLHRKKLKPPNIKRNPVDQLILEDDAKERLNECIVQNWKEMRRALRKLDFQGTGVVSSLDLRHVLRQFNVNLNEQEFYDIVSHHDPNLDGIISYNDFFRSYLKNAV